MLNLGAIVDEAELEYIISPFPMSATYICSRLCASSFGSLITNLGVTGLITPVTSA